LGRIKPTWNYSEKQLKLVDFMVTSLCHLNSFTTRELRRLQFAGMGDRELREEVARYTLASMQMNTLIGQLERLRRGTFDVPERIVFCVEVICNDCPRQPNSETQNEEEPETRIAELLLATLDPLHEAILNCGARIFPQQSSRQRQQIKLYGAVGRLSRAADRQRKYATEGLPARVPKIDVEVGSSEFCSLCGAPMNDVCKANDLTAQLQRDFTN
jgi:hypothetical protein